MNLNRLKVKAKAFIIHQVRINSFARQDSLRSFSCSVSVRRPDLAKSVPHCSQDLKIQKMALTFSPECRPKVPIEREVIQVPGAKNKEKLAFVLHNVLTKEECDQLIKETEKKGYDVALVNVGFGMQRKMTDIRNSSRCIVDDEPYANELWYRIREFIPDVFNNRRALGLNERLRFLRYDPGEYFKPHYDGMYRRENGERSLITFQLYLNEGFKGGATNFISSDTVLPVVPKTGSVLIFQHDIFHEGEALKKGRKYTVRTDIMYSAETIS